jgi:hypothetical protein
MAPTYHPVTITGEELECSKEAMSMGMDLSGAGRYFRWSAGGWREILDLGLQHG